MVTPRTFDSPPPYNLGDPSDPEWAGVHPDPFRTPPPRRIRSHDPIPGHAPQRAALHEALRQHRSVPHSGPIGAGRESRRQQRAQLRNVCRRRYALENRTLRNEGTNRI